MQRTVYNKNSNQESFNDIFPTRERYQSGRDRHLECRVIEVDLLPESARQDELLGVDRVPVLNQRSPDGAVIRTRDDEPIIVPVKHPDRGRLRRELHHTVSSQLTQA